MASSSQQAPPTLLSALESAYKPDALHPYSYHPFASSVEESYATLQDLNNKISHLSHSLTQYLSAPFDNPKLIPILRQQTAASHQIYVSDRNLSQLINAFTRRPSTIYGEDVPFNPNAVIKWCLSRFEEWGRAAKMEIFLDESPDGSSSLLLGGKVLVIDVKLDIDKSNPARPIRVRSVETSYASAQGSRSPMLDAFLAEMVGQLVGEVQRQDGIQDVETVAKLGGEIRDHLVYLMMLDRLATRQRDGGIRWFIDVDELYPKLQRFAREESKVIARSLGMGQAPLDLFLQRAHALPFLYLSSPSLCFLVYLSPFAYFTALQRRGNKPDIDHENAKVDIPMSEIKSLIKTTQRGISLATLKLIESPYPSIFPNAMPMATTRPSFPLVSRGNDLDHTFPQLSDPTLQLTTPVDTPSEHNAWVLDFTNNGRQRGIVMTQTRMRDILSIVNPLGGSDNIRSVPMMAFGTGSWVDLLINPDVHISPERYTAIYESPSGAHPPLQLRLTAPEEPGFFLDKIPVTSLKEVWGALEIVREQCWLNETLLTCDWVTDGLQQPDDVLKSDVEATELELDAILSGTARPRKLPVNIYLPNPAADSLFVGDDLESINQSPYRTRITMTSPEKPPLPGLVEISVTYDETQPKGLIVEIHGAMGLDVRTSDLEEICRRGGTLGLSGRVWAKAQSL